MPESLNDFDEVLQEACNELTEQAFSGNLSRVHHLADAVACFDMIGILLKAQDIIHDVPEEPPNEEPTT